MQNKPVKEKRSRIQQNNRKRILEAALEVFSTYGFRGSTLDQVAEHAEISKPNILYYYSGKSEIYIELLYELLDLWLDPLRKLDNERDPIDEIVEYVLRKLELSKNHPRESRLFANEIFQGAPRIEQAIRGELRTLVNEKTKLIEGWVKKGQIADVDPYHLIFSIWATTQHYADFETQILMVKGQKRMTQKTYDDAAQYLERLYRQMLAP